MATFKDAFRTWFRRWTNSLYAGLTALLAVFAGVLGSVYSNEVAHAWPFAVASAGAWGPISYKAVLFWVSLVAFFVLFLKRQKIDDEATESLLASTETIRGSIRSLQPIFLRKFAQTADQLYKALSGVLPRRSEGYDATILAQIARSVLSGIAGLALVFDDRPVSSEGDSPTYGANVMVYIARSSSDPFFPEEIRKSIVFFPRESDLRSLKGVLHLRLDLSTTTKETDIGSDPTLKSISLPIPEQEKDERGKWKVLPGAPLAFVTGKVDAYQDSLTLPEWCEKEGDFLKSVREDIREYFTTGPGRGSRSLVSQPLVSPDATAFGVMNIHCNRKDMPQVASDRYELFQAVLTPLVRELVEIVSLLLSTEREAADRSRSRGGSAGGESSPSARG